MSGPSELLVQIQLPRKAAAPEGDDDVEFGIEISESSRRRFLSLMSGSLALAGLTGCTRQPTEMIMPYVDPPENVIPGQPKYYASAIQVNGLAQGVLVESHLGRPTKVEGNPVHPASLGASSVIAQACLMDLYDPDRAQGIRHLGVPETWQALQIALNTITSRAVNGGTGSKFRILSETVTSPALADRISAVLKAIPGAQWHQYEPAGAHSARAASQTVFGKPVNTYYRFDTADIVLSLDSDFLACGPNSTRYTHDFAVRRRKGNRLDMNRLYVVETSMSSTGGKADHRRSMRYTEVEAFARQVAGIIQNGAAQSLSQAGFAKAVARDLMAHRGASIVIPGEHQSPAVHALAHSINAALGNSGKTVIHTDPIEAKAIDQIASLRQLVIDIDEGNVDTLLMLGGNPVYNAPVDFRFLERLKKVPTSIHISSHNDETAVNCTWHVAETHSLEAWGDSRAFDGTVTIQQPLILPLYDSRTYIEVLDVIAQTPGRPAYDIVRSYWQTQHKGNDFEAWWRKSVHDGVIDGSALPAINAVPAAATMQTPAPQPQGGIEIVFRPDEYMHDGRHANNVWLQELPHPMTKLTWDNAIHLNSATAKQLNVQAQEQIEISYEGNSVIGTVWLTPGQPDNSITLHLGYGRWQSGRAGNGAGFNAYTLRRSDAMWNGAGIYIRKTGTSYPLATTQMEQSMQDREPVLSASLDEYRKKPDFAQHASREPEDNDTLYKRWDYTGYAWGMSIDLTACVNCNACVVACQAENNIPVVGKEQVLARRAMHWLRIDTYYEGRPEDPSAYYQPVPCMQCEQAPCELVCPTQATNHSSDGLNDMVYNRCVGTRYCSNNCPYKVRRFNFLLYSDWTTESWKLQRNPDVTVRSRGVMEKCTYCVQRIRETEIRARDEDRYIQDGEIKTACQQACPTQAIVFGDINNRANRVSQLKAEKLNYALLAELNTRPRTTYLAELRNPNPALEGNKA